MIHPRTAEVRSTGPANRLSVLWKVASASAEWMQGQVVHLAENTPSTAAEQSPYPRSPGSAGTIAPTGANFTIRLKPKLRCPGSHMILRGFAILVLMLSVCHAQEQTPSPAAKPSINTTTPRVWIFNGTPGDAEHHDFYEENLASLRHSLTQRFAVPTGNITVLYGPKSAGYDGPCTREALLAELAKIVVHTKTASAAPVWIIFEGHANAVSGGAMFNLPGPDVSMREIGDALKECAPQTPLIVVGTTTMSGVLVKRVSGPGRCVITASAPGDKENETEYPRALARALAAEASDANHDGVLSLTELFLATNEAVLAIYKQGDYIVKEHAQLDGNGDGRATQRPAQEDADAADRIGLAIGGGKPKFE